MERNDTVYLLGMYWNLQKDILVDKLSGNLMITNEYEIEVTLASLRKAIWHDMNMTDTSLLMQLLQLQPKKGKTKC